MVFSTSCHLHPTAIALSFVFGGFFQSASCGDTMVCGVSLQPHGDRCAWGCVGSLHILWRPQKPREGTMKCWHWWEQVAHGESCERCSQALKVPKCSPSPAEQARIPEKQSVFWMSKFKIYSLGIVIIIPERWELPLFNPTFQPSYKAFELYCFKDRDIVRMSSAKWLTQCRLNKAHQQNTRGTRYKPERSLIWFYVLLG